jgi:plasmid stabilization system protein ParE
MTRTPPPGWYPVSTKAQSLRDFPEIGYEYRSEPEGDIRILLYGHYRIAYLFKRKEQIDILSVFHGAMEIDRYLA